MLTDLNIIKRLKKVNEEQIKIICSNDGFYLFFIILIRSVSIADAVSNDPAPLPITVMSSAKSVVTFAKFKVPSI